MAAEVLLPFFINEPELTYKDEIWVISFVSFNTFLVIFQPKYWFALYFTTQAQHPRQKSNWVWAHAAFGLEVFAVITKVTPGSEEIQRYYKSISMLLLRVTPTRQKIRTQWAAFCFIKKAQPTHSKQKLQIEIIKEWQASSR